MRGDQENNFKVKDAFNEAFASAVVSDSSSFGEFNYFKLGLWSRFPDWILWSRQTWAFSISNILGDLIKLKKKKIKTELFKDAFNGAFVAEADRT